MATHLNTLAWRIPWTKEPGWLQPMGLQRVEHDLAPQHACISEYKAISYGTNISLLGDIKAMWKKHK